MSIKDLIKRVIPDRLYIRYIHKKITGTRINLHKPVTFTEKLQWLKLNDRKKEYVLMVDKCEAKKYVANMVGEEHIIPTFGVWNSFDDIDFNSLPKQFVLKCTHDSGGLVICKDKDTFDYEKAKKKINNSLKHNYYYLFREWPYKHVKPRIIAEKYMSDVDSYGIIDYKFYCFNGNPRFLYISKGLDDHSTASISFVNLDWTFAKYERNDYRQFAELPEKPTCFDEMIEIAKKLSRNLYFVRVDLYQIDGIVYFSELTFSPCGGYMPFKNIEHDFEIGKMLHLPCDK